MRVSPQVMELSPRAGGELRCTKRGVKQLCETNTNFQIKKVIFLFIYLEPLSFSSVKILLN